MIQKLEQGNEVFIIWTKKYSFVQFDGIFLSYINSKQSNRTPLFSTEHGNIIGEDCFWILKSKIKKSSDIIKYQKMIMPLQVLMVDIANKLNAAVPQKVQYKELDKMVKQRISRKDKLKFFIEKYGFNPTDDSWIETHLVTNDTEQKWFRFTREHNFPIPNQDVIDLFNKENNTNISTKEAKDLTVKKMRYIFGSYITRQQGNSNTEQWKEEAVVFEKKFREREIKMKNWSLSRNGNYPWVITKKPLEFWCGSFLLKCVEKIPHVFTSPSCEFIKAGIALEVRGYDTEEKWIDLDFTPDVRKILSTEQETDYAIVLHPDNVGDFLEGLENLEKK